MISRLTRRYLGWMNQCGTVGTVPMVVAVLVERWACDDRPDPLIIGMTVSVRVPISPKSESDRIGIPLWKEIRNRPDRCGRARSCDGHSAHDECVASCAPGTTTSWRLIIRIGKVLHRRAPDVNTVLNDIPSKRIESTVAMNLPSPRSSSAVIAARAASTQSIPPPVRAMKASRLGAIKTERSGGLPIRSPSPRSRVRSGSDAH